MTEQEQAVIEAAVEWAMWRAGRHYGPGVRQYEQASTILETMVEELHAEHDGHWQCPA